jgi:hypothetical protein
MESPFVWWQWTFIVLGLSVAAVLAGLGLAYFILRAQKKPWPFGWPVLNKADSFPVIQTQIFSSTQAVAPREGSNADGRKTDSSSKKKRDPIKKPEETIAQYIQSRTPPTPSSESVRAPTPPLPRSEPVRVPQPRKVEPRRVPPPPKAEPARAAAPKVEPLRAIAPKVEPVRGPKSDLLREVEGNLTIAATAVRGKLMPFHSDALNLNRTRLLALSSEIQEDIGEAYTDMRLANTLVWLSKDMGRQSGEMESGYLELCGKISERLARAVPGLINSGM